MHSVQLKSESRLTVIVLPKFKVEINTQKLLKASVYSNRGVAISGKDDV